MSSAAPSGTPWMPKIVSQDSRFRTSYTHQVHDWSDLRGATVEVRLEGTYLRTGCVEEATAEMLWLAQDGVESRMLIDKFNGYELWIDPQQLPFLKRRG